MAMSSLKAQMPVTGGSAASHPLTRLGQAVFGVAHLADAVQPGLGQHRVGVADPAVRADEMTGLERADRFLGHQWRPDVTVRPAVDRHDDLDAREAHGVGHSGSRSA
jgi:hypothetical protein